MFSSFHRTKSFSRFDVSYGPAVDGFFAWSGGACRLPPLTILCFPGVLSLFSSGLRSSSCSSSVSTLSQFSPPVSLFSPPLMLPPLSSCLFLSSGEGSSALQSPHVLVGFVVLLAVFLIRFPVHRVVAKTLSSLLHPPARHYIRAHLAVPEGGVAGFGSGRNIQLHSRKLGGSQVRRSLVSFLGGSFRRGDGVGEHGEKHSYKKGSLLRTGAGTRRGDCRRRRQQLPLTLVVDLDETLVLATRSRVRSRLQGHVDMAEHMRIYIIGRFTGVYSLLVRRPCLPYVAVAVLD